MSTEVRASIWQPSFSRAAALLVIATACGGFAAAAASTAGAGGAALLGVAGIAGALLLRLPTTWWPSLVLLVTVAAPADALPVPGMRGQNGSISPALLLVPLWLVVELRRGRLWRGVSSWHRVGSATAIVLALVLAASTAGSDSFVSSAAWSLNLLLVTAAVALIMRRDSARLLATTWIVAGGVLGAYALAEVFVLPGNLLWGWAGSGGARASASFGHPLHAATFFASATVLGVRRSLARPTPSAVVLTAACAGGLAATGSRGALVATVVGLTFVGAAIAAGRSGPRRQLALFVVVAIGFSAVVGLGLAQRTAAGGEEGSNAVRSRSLATGLHLAGQTGPLGQGPGQAYSVKVTTPGPGTDEERSVENAWLELYIGIGPVGCAAFATFVLACLAGGVRAGSWGAVATAVTLLVAFGFYNALEGAKPLTMLLLGLALGGCLAPALTLGPGAHGSPQSRVPSSGVVPGAAPGCDRGRRPRWRRARRSS